MVAKVVLRGEDALVRQFRYSWRPSLTGGRPRYPLRRNEVAVVVSDMFVVGDRSGGSDRAYQPATSIARRAGLRGGLRSNRWRPLRAECEYYAVALQFIPPCLQGDLLGCSRANRTKGRVDNCLGPEGILEVG